MTKIEIWPFGDDEGKRTIATLKIANIGTNHDNFAKYAVVLESDDGEQWAYVPFFPRDLGAIALVGEALATLMEQENEAS